MANNRLWSEEEAAAAIQMSGDGAFLIEIGYRLGRTVDSVRNMLRRRGVAQDRVLSAVSREENKRRRAAWRAANPISRERSGVISLRTKATPEMIEQRDRCYEEPRTLTMELLGDPTPSRSALRRFCP